MTVSESIAPAEAPARPQQAAVTRLHFLDHLRAAVIVLVVILHASMTYMAYPPLWWYVIEPENGLLFTTLVLALDVPIMQILFFIAGFFAYPSLVRYGTVGFMRQKLVRIGLPWVVGVVFLAPLVTYLIPYTRGLAGSYLDFWTGDFWTLYYQQSVYWFLGVLLLLFAGLAAVYHFEPGMQGLERRAVVPDRRLFVTFWALTTMWFFASSLLMPADSWINVLKLVVFQPARLMLYAGYFMLGIYADRRGWFRDGGYQPAPDNWVVLALASGTFYLALRLYIPGDGLWWLLAQAGLFNAFCLSMLMASVAFFQRQVNRPTRVWSSLSRNAYSIYYVHPLVLYPLAMVFLSVQLTIFLEVPLLVTMTVLICWAIGALVLTRLPVLRDIFYDLPPK